MTARPDLAHHDLARQQARWDSESASLRARRLIAQVRELHRHHGHESAGLALSLAALALTVIAAAAMVPA